MIRVSAAEIRRLRNEGKNVGLMFPKPVTLPKVAAKPKRAKRIRRVSPMKAAAIVEFLRLKPLAFARDGGRCLLCGMALKKWTAHHIEPTAQGGENVLWNLAAICCNSGGYGACHETAHTMGVDAKLELYRRLAEKYGVAAFEYEENGVWRFGLTLNVGIGGHFYPENEFPNELMALRAGLAARVAATGDPFDPAGGHDA